MHVELAVGQPVRVLALVLQPHEVDDVDDAHLQVRQVPAQEIGGRERLQRRHVAARTRARRRASRRAPRCRPTPRCPGRACSARSPASMVRKFGCRLLARDDDVDVLARLRRQWS